MNIPSDHCPSTQYSEQFIRGMIDRLAIGYHNYGRIQETHLEYDLLANASKRINKYRETGNTEFLIDAANFIMFEFMFPAVAGAHFRATDSDESPGIVMDGGRTVKNPARFR